MTAVATVPGQPANQIAFVYSPGDVPAAMKSPSSMAVIGRDPMNAGYKPIRDAAVAGKLDLAVYLDMVLSNASGQFHAPMLSGAKILSSGGNGWGRGVDLVNDTAHLARCLAALEAIRTTVPGVTRIFADDFGPDNEALYSTQPASYRGALDVVYGHYADAIAAWADKNGILVFYNGEWRGDRGRGYPDPKQSGCGVLAGMTCEHHDDNLAPGNYWYNQVTGTQGGLRDSAGHPMNIVISSSIGAAQAAGKIPGVGFVTAQTDYAAAGPVVETPRALSISMTGTVTPAPPPSIDPSPAGPATRPVAPPPNLRISVSLDGVVDYAWDASPASDQADAYQAYVNTGTAENLVIAGTSYRLTRQLPPGDYVGRVSAHNLMGYGPWTDPGVPFTVPQPVVVTPPPADDPCADVRAELATTSAARDQAVLDARAAQAALDLANGVIERVRADVA